MIEPLKLSRRNAIGLLLGSAVLPTFRVGRAQAAPNSMVPAQPLTAALRNLDKPNLVLDQVAQISNDRHRVTFHTATWDGGATHVRTLEVSTADGGWLEVTEAPFDEQWTIHTGTGPDHPRTERHWIAFESVEKLNEQTVELRAVIPDVAELIVQWNLERHAPELHWTIKALRTDRFVVRYEGFDGTDRDDVAEVLCGARQHARVIDESPALLAAWELFAPMSLVQTSTTSGPVTCGLYVPSTVLEFHHQRHVHAQRQPFGMGLRNDDLAVTPVACAPFDGALTTLEAGESSGYAFGVSAVLDTATATYENLLRNEYDHRAYRENVYDTSLTDTIHNLVDLVASGPATDDSVDFVPSWSGWWSRAKGFADIERKQEVKAATAAVVLGAHLLTSTPEAASLYAKRALPSIEYQISRRTAGFTPITTASTQHRLGGTPSDASPLSALDLVTQGMNPGLRQLGQTVFDAKGARPYRAHLSASLAMYELTNDSSWLTEATALAHDLVDHDIDPGYTDLPGRRSFGYGYCRYWVDLMTLYRLTGDEKVLAGARKEARRYVTQTMVRPVPDGDITVGQDHLIEFGFDWPTGVYPDYPRTGVDVEDVPAWVVSTSGLAFEGLTTYTYDASTDPDPAGGFTFNPGWTAELLRLAHHANDPLLADIAHNMTIGRWTNYPGYYSRQFTVAQMKPDFPYQGPHGISSIYFHHIPGQLGMTIDYLFAEHHARSDGLVSFPGAHEADYVFFVFDVYGHAPGTFHGEDGVWPWFPAGIITLDNPAINWLTGVGNDSLYISLTNSSPVDQQVTINLVSPITGITADTAIELHQFGSTGTERRRPLRGAAATVTVPGHGHLGLVARGVQVDVPWHRTQVRPGLPGPDGIQAWDVTTVGGEPVQGMVLVRPDASGYDVHVSVDSTTESTLRWRVDDQPWQTPGPKVFPYEWTLSVNQLDATVTYEVTVGTEVSPPIELTAPTILTGGLGIHAAATTVPGGQLRGDHEWRRDSDGVFVAAHRLVGNSGGVLRRSRTARSACPCVGNTRRAGHHGRSRLNIGDHSRDSEDSHTFGVVGTGPTTDRPR